MAVVESLRPLGSGGAGDVYLGRRSDTGEEVVVKFLRDFNLPEARRRFAREVRILSKKMRGLVTLISANVDGERPYYVMKYLAKGSVTAHAGRLNDAQLRTAAFEIAAALATLHAASIAHGDVKPDNILLSDDGHLQIGDPLGNGLGCTMLFSDSRGGTPGYWGPEIPSGAQISPAGDAYSFGATLFHLATGVCPRDGESLAFPPGHFLSPDLRELVRLCCQATPGDRPTMTDVLRLLRGVQWATIQAERRNMKVVLRVVSAAAIIAFVDWKYVFRVLQGPVQVGAK